MTKEARNPNSEARRKSEARILRHEEAANWILLPCCHSDFFRASEFEIRISFGLRNSRFGFPSDFGIRDSDFLRTSEFGLRISFGVSFGLRNSDFGLLSSFVIRHSSFHNAA